MQSIIIITKDLEEEKKYIDQFCKKHGVSFLDLSIIEQEKQDTRSNRGGSIGIENIRMLQKNLYLAPVKGHTKVILIRSAQNLTIEAQNALLKVLEEPPAFTTIILSTSNVDMLLPTILSRCTIIALKEKTTATDKIIGLPDNMSIHTGLVLAQNVGKSREDALRFLENAIRSIQAKLFEETANRMHLAFLIRNLQQTYTIIKTTNVSPRFTLEQLLLSL